MKTPAQKKLVETLLGVILHSEAALAWFDKMEEDNIRTIKALAKQGVLEVSEGRHVLFRFTQEGYDKARAAFPGVGPKARKPKTS